MKQALFYKRLKNKIIQCVLCPHFCTLKSNETGKCRVRKNINGILYSLSYEKPVAINLDPIEKKPLFHFFPSTDAFSIGMAGCNLRCLFCQNWEISQRGPEEIPAPKISAKEIVKKALKSKCPIIAYTYTEPLVSYEYVLDTAKLARRKGIKNIMVTNGFINQEPLKKLYRYIDGANVDFKAFDNDFYVKITGGRLQPVLDSIKTIHKLGVWLELTNLIIPTLNDDIRMIGKMVDWIYDSLGENVPLHFSRFFPYYKLRHLPSTDPKTLLKAYDLARKKLNYVYVGNMLTEKGENTYCPKCGNLVIERRGYEIFQNKLVDGKCYSCGEKISGVWG